MIDWAKVAELQNEIGAEEFTEVSEIFLEEVDDEIAALRSGCPPDALEARLHCLKGSALNLGFADFAALCQIGESAAADGHARQVDVGAIVASFDASKSAFIAGLPRLHTE